MSVLQTQIKVHLGTTTGGSQVGNTITENGSPASVQLNATTLGTALSPGTQYCVIARCESSDHAWSSWSAPYTYKTLILAEITTITAGCGGVEILGSLTYDTNDNNISVSSCGVYMSTSSSGTAAKKITMTETQFTDAQQPAWTEFDDHSSIAENTQYYVVPFVIDQDNREYVGEWADAETITTKYEAPTVTISNVVTTYNSISGNVTIATNDSTVTNTFLTIVPTGGGTAWTVNLSNTKGLQAWSITDGDTADSSTPAGQTTISILPSTEYRVTIYSTNGTGTGCTGTAQATATTAQQQVETIAITSITNITPVSAQVNLSYGTV